MKEKFSNGEKARQDEIFEAARKNMEDSHIEDLTIQALFTMYFFQASEWADDLPESVRSDETLFKNELFLFIDKKRAQFDNITRGDNDSNKFTLSLFMYLILIKGANWARNNPPKEHQ